MSEQFEHSIRKKLQDADIPFDPAAWEQMKKRLDDSDRRRPAIFWWILSGLLILTLAGGGFWWWTSSNNSNPVAQQITVDTAENNTPATSEESQLSTDRPAIAKDSVSEVKVDVNSGRKTNQSSIVTNNGRTSSALNSNKLKPSVASGSNQSSIVTNKVNTSRSSVKTNNRKPSSTSNSDQSTITPNNQNSSQTTIVTSNQLPKEVSNSSDFTIVKNNGNSNQPSIVTNNQNSSPETNSNQSSVAANTTNNTNVDNPTTEDSAKNKKPNRKGLEAGITLGPDYNIAASLKRGKVGFNFGLILKYNLSNRWSIQSGAIYNKKIYGANASEYTFTYPNTYKWVAADCNVLDVPLNVFYNFSENGRNRWSAMIGASSYFMLKEKYDYWYGNGYKVSHEYQNQNQHYFSVVNLGVNWERQTMGRLRWSLQPYVKVPLGGVGQGSIKLYTAGLAVQLTMGKK